MRIKPENTRTYYLALLDELIGRRKVKKVFVGGAQTSESREGDPPLKVDKDTRIKIMLKGEQKHAISRAGKRVDLVARPGEALFWSPHAWTLPHFDRACTFLGIVFRHGFVRLLVGHHVGDGQRTLGTPYWYHTSRPVAGPALHLISALAEQADRTPDPESERQLFVTLLRYAREHLTADRNDLSQGSRALQTFQRVMDYLNQNYADPITRDSVAAALDIHPNYLSALCTQIGKRSFHDTLETLRLDRARHLLRQSDLKLDRVAQLSGYASTNYFIKVFRRTARITPGRYRVHR